MTPAEARRRIRAGELTGPTSGLCLGFLQANLVVLPQALAGDFEEYCRRNAQPMPLLDVTAAGDAEPRRVAPGADLRTDLPRYRVWRHGRVAAEVTDATAHWRPDLVAFLLGCSFTAEARLLAAGVPIRHLDLGRNVSMYRTAIECRPAGRFRGPLVVSMRPLRADLVDLATRVTADLPLAHGAPIHAGDPAALGIRDLARPDYGDPVPVGEDEVPVFWACGVTPQAAIAEVGPEIAITHAPGHMFITDVADGARLDVAEPLARRPAWRCA